MTPPFLKFRDFLGALALVLFVIICSTDPVLAHHPFGMGGSSELSGWQALLSGIGHPLLGPDHLLFMLGIALVCLNKTKKWVFPLLAFGLAGSALVQLQPLPEALDLWAEALVSLSLAIEGLIILNFLSSKWLFPMFAFHGYLLGNTIVGAEPTPLVGYFLGLLLAQGSLLLLLTSASKIVTRNFGVNVRNLFAGIWIGLGFAFSWVAVVP